MIIGNPGIYDSKGNFNSFAIQIDKILDTDNFSVNLCIDMNIYPAQLAYNKASYLIDYFNPKLEIFNGSIHFLGRSYASEIYLKRIKSPFAMRSME